MFTRRRLVARLRRSRTAPALTFVQFRTGIIVVASRSILSVGGVRTIPGCGITSAGNLALSRGRTHHGVGANARTRRTRISLSTRVAIVTIGAVFGIRWAGTATTLRIARACYLAHGCHTCHSITKAGANPRPGASKATHFHFSPLAVLTLHGDITAALALVVRSALGFRCGFGLVGRGRRWVGCRGIGRSRGWRNRCNW